MQLTFLDRTEEAPSIYGFRFTKPAALVFTAGDYVELSLNYGEGGIGGRRWLTLCSAPTDNYVRFTIKIPSEPSKFKQALMALKEGQSAEISPPIGTFNPVAGPMLWVAGGIGATPFYSMATSKEANSYEIVMIYVAKPSEFIYVSTFKKTCKKLHLVQERTTWGKIKETVPDWGERTLYFSGPQGFCETLFYAALNDNHPRNRLKLDYFPGYPSI